MQRSAEWLRGEKAALRRLKPEVWGQGLQAYSTRDLRQLVDSDYFKAERELAAAEAREAFPIPDTLPAVPEASEAGKPTAAEVIAAAKDALTEANDAICGITGLGNMAKQVAIAFSVINRGFKAISAWEANHGK